MTKKKRASLLLLVLSVFSIISITKATLQSWEMIKSSVEITGTKIYTSQSEFNSEIIKTFFNSSGTYLEINSKDEKVEFPQIDSFVKFDGTYYICPSGINQPYVYKYKDSLTKISTLPYGISEYSSWRVRCYYRPKAQSGYTSNAIIVAFLDTRYIYWYKHYRNEWGNQMKKQDTYFIDAFIDDNYYQENDASNPYYYAYYFYYELTFKISVGQITFGNSNEASEPFWTTVGGSKTVVNAENLGNAKVFLKKNSYTDLVVYIITYGPTGHQIYQASTPNIGSTDFTQTSSFQLQHFHISCVLIHYLLSHAIHAQVQNIYF